MYQDNTNTLTSYCKMIAMHIFFSLWDGMKFSFISNLSSSIRFISKICKYKVDLWYWIILNAQYSYWPNVIPYDNFRVSFICPYYQQGNILFLFLTNHFWQVIGMLSCEELSIRFQVNLTPREATTYDVQE